MKLISYIRELINPFSGKSLKEIADKRNRKTFRSRVLEELKDIKSGLRYMAKNGQYSNSYEAKLGQRNYWAHLIALRFVRVKNTGIKITIEPTESYKDHEGKSHVERWYVTLSFNQL